ncbi:MAG: glycosyltransferase family 2 protein [Patescibacteria group bacterium]|nr:glycosyltransferase family 2 protein [Patescibacteria group bacterium]
MTKKLPSLSVFFPCFNEAQNIPELVEQSLQFIPQVARKFELIIVNDGSTDDTKKIAKQLVKQHSQVKLVSHRENRGYGAALQTGFKKSKYDWIFFTDGDLQFNIKEFKKFIKYTDKYSVVIGYRIKRAEGTIRAFNARLFKLYIDSLFRVHVKDIDCAFKLFKAEQIKSVKLLSTGAFVSAEFLYKLKKKGVALKQVAVKHYLRKFGEPTGANPKVIVKGVMDALKLYLKMKFHLQ